MSQAQFGVESRSSISSLLAGERSAGGYKIVESPEHFALSEALY